MNIVLYTILIVLVIYFEWDLVFTMLSPLVDIGVAVFFIAMLLTVIVVELALMVVAPVALVFGLESREWHIKVAKKLMFVGGQRNDDVERIV